MAFDSSYGVPIYEEQGGTRLVVGTFGGTGGVIDIESGGSLTVKSGGSIDVESGGSIGTGEAADANTLGVAQVIHRIDIADASGDTDVVLENRTLVTDVVVHKEGGAGGAGDTVTVKNGSNAITDAMDLNVADQTVVRVGTIDDTHATINAAGTLKVTAAKATNVTCMVVVEGVRVA